MSESQKRPSGTYFIRVRSAGWYVWYQHFVDQVRTREPVDKKAVRDLGFKPEMSIEQAKAQV